MTMSLESFFGLAGKKVLITGATGGIGGQIAKTLLDLGAICTLSGTNEQKLQSLSDEYSDYKDRVFFKKCNLADQTECESLVNESQSLMGGIDILICNAGITKDGLLVRMSSEQWNSVINVNLTANFILSKTAIKYMMKQKSGSIIFTSSIIGLTGNAGQANYAASKAGLGGLAKSIALEYGSKGIRANVVAPGFIKTEMTQGIDDSKLLDKIPLARQGDAGEIAKAVTFLCGSSASYITGETLSVNGGMFMA
jgi:3-oxoacyl-[acyl-carrier protein] reductase